MRKNYDFSKSRPNPYAKRDETEGNRSEPEPLPLRRQLLALAARLRDLHPLVRDHVYHPAFAGSFSLKSVLPALVPDLDYADLDIQEGHTASATLEELLLRGEAMPEGERERLRRSLLAYCERDTLAMVRLCERLRGLGGVSR